MYLELCHELPSQIEDVSKDTNHVANNIEDAQTSPIRTRVKEEVLSLGTLCSSKYRSREKHFKLNDVVRYRVYSAS